MKRRRVTTPTHNNRVMNSDTYQLRKKVMSFVYKAKKLVSELPRVELRITDAVNDEVLGSAMLGCNIIWITAKAVEEYGEALKAVVFHEILHAVYSTPHIDNCPLMAPLITTTDDQLIESLFLKYASAR